MIRLPALAVLCACGCPRAVHRHYSRGSYCGWHKECQRWRPRLRRIRLTGEDLRLLAAAAGFTAGRG